MNKALLLLATGLLMTRVGLAETTVIVNVNVVPMSSEQIVPQQTVVVVDDKITELGHVDTVRVPEEAIVIDGTDRFLMPGLGEMHAHVTSTDAVAFDRLATLFVANGVTTIRGMLGRPAHLDLRSELEAGTRFGPRLHTSGPSLNGRSVAGRGDAEEKVRTQKAAGYDFLKVHPGLSSEEFTGLADTANEIGIPYAGHVPVAAGLDLALQKKMATIDHLDGYFAALLPADEHGKGGYGGFFDVMLADVLDAGHIADVVAMTRDAGTWNVPTEVLIEQMIDATPTIELEKRPEMRFVSKATLQEWVDNKTTAQSDRDFDPETAARAVALRRQLIFELHSAGAGLLLGSDAPQIFNVPGFSIHRELKVLVEAGLTPYEALYTGTVAVAEFLSSNGGSVAVGRDADLVLLDANPLEDIANSKRIHGVMLRGHWFTDVELEEKLARYQVPDS